MPRRLVITALAALAFAAPAAATTATLQVTPTVTSRGQIVTFTGSGCNPGDSAILISRLFPGHAYGLGAITAKVRANGHFRRRFRILMSTVKRRYTITARCGGGNLGVAVHVRVR